MLRQTEVLNRDADRGQEPGPVRPGDPVSSTFRLALERAISAGSRQAFGPPSASNQSSTATIEGVLMVSPGEDAFRQLALGGHAEKSSAAPGRRIASSRVTAGAQRSMPCAASPPSAFCQEKVTHIQLVPRHSIANAAEVASQMVRPSRSRQSVAVRHFHAAGGAFPRRTPRHGAGRYWPRSGSSPYGALNRRVVGMRRCFTVSVTQSSENFPGEKIDRAAPHDQSGISTAPVSEAGRRPGGKSCGMPSSALVRSMASLSLGLAGLERWERPTMRPQDIGLHPGRLAQGPTKKKAVRDAQRMD